MADVDIILQTIDRTRKGMDSSQRRMQAWSKSWTDKGRSFQSLEKQKAAALIQAERDKREAMQRSMATFAKYTIAAAAVGMAVKKIFDFAEAGAQVGRMTQSFKLLGVSMDDLQEAAGGTVDKMTLMTATAKLVAGTTGQLKEEMQKAAPALLEVARAAVILDPSIGSVAFVYESLAKGIKKGQPLLIDNANIILKVGAANERMAEALGKSVEELTAEEKQMAILNDTVRAGQVLIEQIGGITDDTATSYERFRAALKDSTDQNKMFLSEGLEPTVRVLGELIKQDTALNQVMKAGLATRWEVTAQMLKGVFTSYTMADSIEWAAEKTREATAATDKGTPALELAQLATAEHAAEVQMLAEAAEELSDVLKSQMSLIGELQKAGEKFQEKAEKLSERRIKIEQDRADAISEGWDENSDKIREYDDALAENSEKAEENAEDHDKANKEIMFGMLERKLLADGQLDQKEFDWLIAKGVEWGIYSETVKEEAQEAFAEVERLINEIPDTKQIDIQINKAVSVRVNMYEMKHLRPGGYQRGTNGYKEVPAGFPNDSFPINLTSGEKFQVIPAGQTGGDSGQQSVVMDALLILMRNLPEDIKRGNRDLVEKLGRR